MLITWMGEFVAPKGIEPLIQMVRISHSKGSGKLP